MFRIGIQGGKGSFNEQALEKYLQEKNQSAEIVYLHNTKNVLEALQNGEIDYGQFALHNTLGGPVRETLASLGHYSFEVVDHYSMKISHCLMVLPQKNQEDGQEKPNQNPNQTKIQKIQTIMAHEQVLLQCKHNLAQKYPNLELKAGSGDLIDNGAIAKALSEGKLPASVAVLAGEQLAQIYGFEILERDLQDSENNFTTFLLVGKIGAKLF